MIVVADSSPIRYLILIDEIRLLPELYGAIVLPVSVVHELTQRASPAQVRNFMEDLPNWATVRTARKEIPDLPARLGRGEREAIALAEELQADVLLVDDESARLEATRRRIPVQGTLGVLDLGAAHGLLTDFPAAIQKLKATNFRASQRLFDYLLARHKIS